MVYSAKGFRSFGHSSIAFLDNDWLSSASFSPPFSLCKKRCVTKLSSSPIFSQAELVLTPASSTDRPTIRKSTFQDQYHLDLKSKVVSLNDQTLEICPDLKPINHGAIQPYLKCLAFLAGTFQASQNVDLKSKSIISLFGQTLKIISDHNPISHGVHLILFQTPSHLDRYF